MTQQPPFTVQRGIFYFPTFESARAYAIANDYPADRINHFELGWAIQKRISGPYVGRAEAHDKPLAADGLTSFRYRGPYGWIMIGAKDSFDALREARRSTDSSIDPRNLQVWIGDKYVNVEL